MDTPTATTPSPSHNIHTPPTPKHGYSDSWEPFSPRKSARLSSQQQQTSTARTPSPTSSSKRQPHHPRSPQSSRRDFNAMSPAASPKKKRFPAVDSIRRASGQLTAESTANAAASLGLHGKTESRQNRAANAGMLPTPSKTPARKQTSAQNEANIAAIARNLFHGEEDVIPDHSTPTASKKKRAKKYTGFSLDSFTAVEEEEPIQIFTDTRERIPEVDKSLDNPFYGHGAAPAPEPSKRRSKRNHVSIPGEGAQSVDEAVHRDDGLLYVFRGKKIFRKFGDEAEGAESDVATEEAIESSQPKRFTRSSIKPRLLFPTKGKAPEELDEEEAATDIEEDQVQEEQEELPQTPAKLATKFPGTPEAPKFAPVSPPSTMRATRSGHKAADDLTPVKATRGGSSKRSPFDDWRRSKSSTGGAGQKRAAADLGSVAPAKRARTSHTL